MPRPRLCRKVDFNPHITFFKPQGVPLQDIDIIELTMEEIESYKLRYINNLNQKEASKKMQTSQSTYQRILLATCKKIADVIINGKALKIIK
jgi:predicted DNA-binding protein (UPF0251 family)